MYGFVIRRFIFTELRGKEVSFTAKVLAAAGDGWAYDILKKVEGLSTWMGTGVTAEGCLAVGSDGR
jgi:hypothetical protein